ncbi:MAG: hypothetical protein GXN99_01400 [Candidatus Nanohaloarchaeota archaeon]|nr:hypothetical protein [Candidatus Nanohaloarchaeota archaeon]
MKNYLRKISAGVVGVSLLGGCATTYKVSEMPSSQLKEATEVRTNVPSNPYAPMYVEQILNQAERYPTSSINERYSSEAIKAGNPEKDALNFGKNDRGIYWVVSPETGEPQSTFVVYNSKDLESIAKAHLEGLKFYNKLKKGNAVNVADLAKVLNVGLYENGGEAHYVMFFSSERYTSMTVIDPNKDNKMPLELISFASGKGFKGIKDAYISALAFAPSEKPQDTIVALYKIDSGALRKALVTTAGVLPYALLPGVGLEIAGINALSQYLISNVFRSNPNNVAAALYSEVVNKCYTTELGALVAGQNKLKMLLGGEDPKNIYHYVLRLPNNSGVVVVSSTSPYKVKRTEEGLYVLEFDKNLGLKTVEEFLTTLVGEAIKVYAIKEHVEHEVDKAGSAKSAQTPPTEGEITPPTNGGGSTTPTTPAQPPVVPYPSSPSNWLGPGGAGAIEAPVFGPTSYRLETTKSGVIVAENTVNAALKEGRSLKLQGIGEIKVSPRVESLASSYEDELVIVKKGKSKENKDEGKIMIADDFTDKDPREGAYHDIVKMLRG